MQKASIIPRTEPGSQCTISFIVWFVPWSRNLFSRPSSADNYLHRVRWGISSSTSPTIVSTGNSFCVTGQPMSLSPLSTVPCGVFGMQHIAWTTSDRQFNARQTRHSSLSRETLMSTTLLMGLIGLMSVRAGMRFGTTQRLIIRLNWVCIEARPDIS